MSTSQAPTNLSPSYQILFQKQQEHAGLQALRETSANLLEKVEKLAEMSNIMADGGEGELLRALAVHLDTCATVPRGDTPY